MTARERRAVSRIVQNGDCAQAKAVMAILLEADEIRVRERKAKATEARSLKPFPCSPATVTVAQIKRALGPCAAF